jgi:hypothetical protein
MVVYGIASDNGGVAVDGTNYPYRGVKGEYFRGGVGNSAILHSKVDTREITRDIFRRGVPHNR